MAITTYYEYEAYLKAQPEHLRRDLDDLWRRVRHMRYRPEKYCFNGLYLSAPIAFIISFTTGFFSMYVGLVIFPIAMVLGTLYGHRTNTKTMWKVTRIFKQKPWLDQHLDKFVEIDSRLRKIVKKIRVAR